MTLEKTSLRMVNEKVQEIERSGRNLHTSFMPMQVQIPIDLNYLLN